MKRNLLLSIGLLLAATGCTNLKPEAAARQSEALKPTAAQLSDESAACLSLMGGAAYYVGECLNSAHSR